MSCHASGKKISGKRFEDVLFNKGLDCYLVIVLHESWTGVSSCSSARYTRAGAYAAATRAGSTEGDVVAFSAFGLHFHPLLPPLADLQVVPPPRRSAAATEARQAPTI